MMFHDASFGAQFMAIGEQKLGEIFTKCGRGKKQQQHTLNNGYDHLLNWPLQCIAST